MTQWLRTAVIEDGNYNTVVYFLAPIVVPRTKRYLNLNNLIKILKINTYQQYFNVKSTFNSLKKTYHFKF